MSPNLDQNSLILGLCVTVASICIIYLGPLFEKKAQTLLQIHFALAQMLGHWRWDLTTVMQHHSWLGRPLDPRNLGRDSPRFRSWCIYDLFLFCISNSLQNSPYCDTVYRVDILHTWRHFCQTMRIRVNILSNQFVHKHTRILMWCIWTYHTYDFFISVNFFILFVRKHNELIFIAIT